MAWPKKKEFLWGWWKEQLAGGLEHVFAFHYFLLVWNMWACFPYWYIGKIPNRLIVFRQVETTNQTKQSEHVDSTIVLRYLWNICYLQTTNHDDHTGNPGCERHSPTCKKQAVEKQKKRAAMCVLVRHGRTLAMLWNICVICHQECPWSTTGSPVESQAFQTLKGTISGLFGLEPREEYCWTYDDLRGYLISYINCIDQFCRYYS